MATAQRHGAIGIDQKSLRTRASEPQDYIVLLFLFSILCSSAQTRICSRRCKHSLLPAFSPRRTTRPSSACIRAIYTRNAARTVRIYATHTQTARMRTYAHMRVLHAHIRTHCVHWHSHSHEQRIDSHK